VSIALLIAFLAWLVVYLVASRRDRRRGSEWRKDALAAGLLALACIGYFWRILLGGSFMPADGGDLISFLWPTYRFAAESLRAGDWPLWNPNLYGGAPHVADIQAGFLYPINLLLFLLLPGFGTQAMESLSVVHLWWAGLGMFVFVRSLRWGQDDEASARIGRPAALAAGIAFAFADPFWVHFGNLNYIAVASWLPWVMVCFARSLELRPQTHPTRTDGLGWAVAGGVLLGVATLAGHIQATLVVGLAVTLYGLFWLLFESREAASRSQVMAALARMVSRVVVLGGIACLVAAPVLLPAVQLAQATTRAEWTYQQAVGYSLAPPQWIGWLIPGFFGRGPQLHWGLWPRVETGYLGVFPLALAFLAILARRNRVTWTLAGIGGVGFVLALGVYSLPHGWLSLLPGFNLVRAPARLILLTDFGLAALAGIGLQVLLGPIGESETWKALTRFSDGLGWIAKVLLVIVVPLTFAALLLGQDKDPTVYLRVSVAAIGVLFFVAVVLASWGLVAARRASWARPGTLAVLAILLIFLDLASTSAYEDLSETDPATSFNRPQIVAFLAQETEPFRIDARTGIDQLWQPNAALLYGLDDVWGLVNPSVLSSYERYWEGMGSRSSALYDFLNAKYVLAKKDVVLDWDKFELAFDGDPDLNVYRNRDVLPRAAVINTAQVVSDPEQAWSAVQDAAFDPAEQVVIEADGASLPATSSLAGQSTVRWLDRSNNALALQVSTSAPGYLVLSDVWYPGWVAETEIDGKVERQPVLRANTTFQAIPLWTSGTYQVRLRFAPAAWRVGLFVSAATLLMLGGWGLIAWLRRRRATL
jgi:hypothetical protein